MAQVLGLIQIIWKGQNIEVEKGSKLKLGGMKNNTVVAGKRVHRAEEFEASEITGITVLKRGQRLMDVFATGEGSLLAVCDTGQTYAWPDAFLTNRPEATGGEGGKIELKWAAGEPEELLNG